MKKISLFLASLLCCSLLVGCSGAVNPEFNGTYWLDNPIYQDVENGFYEKIEYKLTTVEKDGNFAPQLSELTPEYLDFYLDADKSSYVTELEGKDGLYVYKTKLVIYGEYSFGESGTYAIEGDVTETETTFKGMKDGFACVKSVKKIKNTYPKGQTPTGKNDFATVTAEFTVEYGEKNATLTVDAKDDASKALLSAVNEPVKVKKYNKKDYIDNELMLLAFRNFQYDKTLSYTFFTIESASGVLKEIVGSAKYDITAQSSEEATATANQTIDVNCMIDGNKYNRSFNTFGITFKTTGEFSQAFAYAYYANSIDNDVADAQNRSRHYLVRFYRPMMYNTGYLVYTLNTVSHTK